MGGRWVEEEGLGGVKNEKRYYQVLFGTFVESLRGFCGGLEGFERGGETSRSRWVGWLWRPPFGLSGCRPSVGEGVRMEWDEGPVVRVVYGIFGWGQAKN